MSAGREAPLDSELEDFAEILRTEDSNGIPVIVGGHAAGLWSRYFMAGGVTELAKYLPFRSKDLDVVGTNNLLEALHKRFKGRLTRSEPRSPVFGRLDIPQPGGGFLRVEVLHTVLGLDAKDLARTVRIEIEGVTGRIPLPHLILKAKLECRPDRSGGKAGCEACENDAALRSRLHCGIIRQAPCRTPWGEDASQLAGRNLGHREFARGNEGRRPLGIRFAGSLAIG